MASLSRLDAVVGLWMKSGITTMSEVVYRLESLCPRPQMGQSHLVETLESSTFQNTKRLPPLVPLQRMVLLELQPRTLEKVFSKDILAELRKVA
jgi:hypothetical protein